MNDTMISLAEKVGRRTAQRDYWERIAKANQEQVKSLEESVEQLEAITEAIIEALDEVASCANYSTEIWNLKYNKNHAEYARLKAKINKQEKENE